MDASEKTKYKLAGAVRELMVFTPVDRITVKQIVERCDVTRQTFYRNFKDKYDLINWYFDKLAIVSFRQMGVSLTLREGLIKKFEFIKGERCFFTAAFKSVDHNSLVQHDFDVLPGIDRHDGSVGNRRNEAEHGRHGRASGQGSASGTCRTFE